MGLRTKIVAVVIGLAVWQGSAGAWIYVSRGTGYWGPPLRLGAPAEIAHIRRAAELSDDAAEMVFTDLIGMVTLYGLDGDRQRLERALGRLARQAEVVGLA